MASVARALGDRRGAPAHGEFGGGRAVLGSAKDLRGLEVRGPPPRARDAGAGGAFIFGRLRAGHSSLERPDRAARAADVLVRGDLWVRHRLRAVRGAGVGARAEHPKSRDTPPCLVARIRGLGGPYGCRGVSGLLGNRRLDAVDLGRLRPPSLAGVARIRGLGGPYGCRGVSGLLGNRRLDAVDLGRLGPPSLAGVARIPIPRKLPLPPMARAFPPRREQERLQASPRSRRLPRLWDTGGISADLPTHPSARPSTPGSFPTFPACRRGRGRGR